MGIILWIVSVIFSTIIATAIVAKMITHKSKIDADRIRKQARENSQKRIEKAKSIAVEIVKTAKAKAEKIESDAREKAEKLKIVRVCTWCGRINEKPKITISCDACGQSFDYTD